MVVCVIVRVRISKGKPFWGDGGTGMILNELQVQ